MKTLWIAAALATAVGAAASASLAAPAADERQLLGPMAAELRNRVGAWNVQADIRFTPEARPIHLDATAENRLVGGRWLVTELRASHSGGGIGFEGVGVNGFDPARGKYVGYWIDGTRGQAIAVEGDYDAASRTFRTTSREQTAAGKEITVVSETRTLGPDEEIVTFTAPDAQGRPFTRMQLHYRRAPR